MRVLVAVASKHGSTWEIGQAIGEILHERGHRAIVVRVEDIDGLEDYDAVVLGSAVYAGHWLRPAQHFASVFSAQLLSLPVWLFSSGPLGKPPRSGDERSVSIGKMVRLTQPKGHRIFAGKLDKKQLGFAERAILTAVRAPEGDFREWEAIRGWAAAIADFLDEGGRVQAGAQEQSSNLPRK